MKIKYLSITFWFNVYREHMQILDVFQKELKEEYQNFNVTSLSDNLLAPVIRAFNKENRTNISMSQINFQFNMDNVNESDISVFKEKALMLFDLLENNGLKVLRTSMLLNCEKELDDALKEIIQNTINPTIISDDLVDVSLTIGKKEEDLFYKTVTLLNKKKIKFPKKYDEQGRLIPIPLVSWNGALVESEVLEVSYEINDKYLYDNTKNYSTTEFYLNKMLYILETNYESDICDILEKGEFN